MPEDKVGPGVVNEPGGRSGGGLAGRGRGLGGIESRGLIQIDAEITVRWPRAGEMGRGR